ncbi:MAG TPA: IS1595 family transposase [Acidobacteriaceae bacterium]|jgi:transposase-like protein|nr:IS1595 family transposase [Acidobacteriaceae bacterium]
MNLIDVTKQFPTDDECLKYIEQMRWPDGVVWCPNCALDRISRITRHSKSKNVRKGFFQCLNPECKQQFSATSGTILNDSHLPLHKWFMALAIVVDAKKGISANQLKEHLGIGSYRTAWYMAHRIRKAMEDNSGDLLTGHIEMDETYIGGKTRRRGKKRNEKPISERFDMVLGMRERKGRVKFVHIPDGKTETIRKAVSKHVDPRSAAVYTDSAAVYQFALHPWLKHRHKMVNHTIEWIVPDTNIHTNTVESSFSLLKRGLIGSFHRVSIKHLQRYLHEFEFRWNIRKDEDRFTTTLRRMAGIAPMPYVELIAVPKTEA